MADPGRRRCADPRRGRARRPAQCLPTRVLHPHAGARRLHHDAGAAGRCAVGFAVMPIALVHGNPETSVVWGPLVRELVARGSAEPVLLSPPGFGAPVPPGFGSTAEEYRTWLV